MATEGAGYPKDMENGEESEKSEEDGSEDGSIDEVGGPGFDSRPTRFGRESACLRRI